MNQISHRTKMANAREQKNRAVDRLRAFVKKFRAVTLNTARAVAARKQKSQDKKDKDIENRRYYDEMRKKRRAFDIEFQKKHGFRPKRKHALQHCKDNDLPYDFSDVNGHNYREIGGQVGENKKVVDPRGKHSRDSKAWREAVRSQKPT